MRQKHSQMLNNIQTRLFLLLDLDLHFPLYRRQQNPATNQKKSKGEIKIKNHTPDFICRSNNTLRFDQNLRRISFRLGREKLVRLRFSRIHLESQHVNISHLSPTSGEQENIPSSE